MIVRLAQIAIELDESGFTTEATMLDDVLRLAAWNNHYQDKEKSMIFLDDNQDQIDEDTKKRKEQTRYQPPAKALQPGDTDPEFGSSIFSLNGEDPYGVSHQVADPYSMGMQMDHQDKFDYDAKKLQNPFSKYQPH